MRNSTLSFGILSLVLSGCGADLKTAANLKLDTKVGLSTKVDVAAKTDAVAKTDAPSASSSDAPALEAALTSKHRSEDNRSRDKFRHPRETLEFFGVQPNMTVLEVEPGADAWYAEILAPILRKEGKLVLTNFDVNGPEKSPLTREAKALQAKLSGDPTVYDKVETVTLTPTYTLGAPESVDMVVSFRTLHLWHQDGTEAKVFKAMFDVLKPGGILGIEQHRAFANAKPGQSARQGYMPQPYVIEQIEKAGFVFEGESHVNTNSWDTKDYKRGVWTLPPSLALGDKDRAKYEKIGESDRMTLRFRKPGKPAEQKTDQNSAVAQATADVEANAKAAAAKVAEGAAALEAKAKAAASVKAPEIKAPEVKAPAVKAPKLGF
jgi:predicted methyltransferase